MRRARSNWIRLVISFVCSALWLAAATPVRALNPPEEEPATVESEAPVDAYARVPVPDPHDPKLAMHPVRVVAYALHPVGVVLDWVLVRPAVWVARQEPFRTLFGYED